MEEKEKKTFKPKRLSKAEMDDITSKIEERLNDFIKEGKYKEVLLAMGNLGKYSLNNQIYILMQMPEARTVAGMKKWNVLGRHVKPGSHSLKIFTPIIKAKEVELKDKDGNPLLNPDGTKKTQKKQVLTGFEQGYVFDISQTDGKPLEVFRFDEKKVVSSKNTILQGLHDVAEKNGYTISYATKEELGEGCYGLCDHAAKQIKILENMFDLQEISTTVHECGHMLAHSAYRKDFDGLTPMEKREIKEVEAESIACVVCSYLGLDTENFNFSYITGWADGDITKFQKNLNVISKHAKTLIEGIESEIYREAKKEKQLGETHSKTGDPPKIHPAVMQPQKQLEAEMG